MKKIKGTARTAWAHEAKENQNNEYYTRMEDVEKELCHYSKSFAGKSIYLCCDSPRASQFWNYFEARFTELGLARLVATHYFNGKDTEAAILETVDGEVVRRDVPLAGKGDFRSPECRAYMEAADIVITNPPFGTLIQELMAMIDETGVDYLIIGPNHALTYKPFLAMIEKGRCHSGVNNVNKFEICPGEYKSVQANWFTNLDPDVEKHVDLVDAPAASYQSYLNFDAIEVPRVKEIPDNYYGVMGVPISFFTKWNPDEFEFVGMARNALILVDGEEKKLYPRILIRRRRHVEKRAYTNLVVLDSRFEAEAYEECRQTMITEYGVRLYALTTKLSYRGQSMVFAIPLRKNIRWDTSTRWYVPTQSIEGTKPSNHAGFDCSKMVPVCREVVAPFLPHRRPHPAQIELAAHYGDLVEKAQAYLFQRESRGPSNTFETDVDAIAKWVLPRFSERAA